MAKTSAPPDTLGIRHIALNVADLAGMEKFYTTILGYRVEWRPDSENVYLTRDADNLALHVDPVSGKGSLDCVPTWGTDFRKDLSRVDVPTLVIHGDADRITPLAATATRTHKAVKGARLLVVEGGPHGLTSTHADKVNPELVDFLK